MSSVPDDVASTLVDADEVRPGDLVCASFGWATVHRVVPSVNDEFVILDFGNGLFDVVNVSAQIAVAAIPDSIRTPGATP